MDVLSDVLENFRLRSTVFAETALSAPWGIRAEPRPEFAFHIVSRGHCWFEVDGEPPAEAASGDVLLLAPGRGHTLRDDPATEPVRLDVLISTGAFARKSPSIEGDADARITQLVCGCFQVEEIGSDILRAALPPVLHTREMSNDVAPWIAQTLRLLTYEAASARPGKSTIVNRLCDALFVYLIRSYLSTPARQESSWLRGLVDGHVSRALQLIHQRPEAPWTVATLAEAVGMSRSAFASRFQQVVGRTPIKYLADWRLQKAAALLRRGDLALAEVAARHGYESEAAFSKAFKRRTGMSPGAYRRAARDGSTADVASALTAS